MNRKTVVNKTLYVAIAQSKKECPALLTKNYMNRMATVKERGEPICNSSKIAAPSSNFLCQVFLSFNRKVHIFASL